MVYGIYLPKRWNRQPPKPLPVAPWHPLARRMYFASTPVHGTKDAFNPRFDYGIPEMAVRRQRGGLAWQTLLYTQSKANFNQPSNSTRHTLAGIFSVELDSFPTWDSTIDYQGPGWGDQSSVSLTVTSNGYVGGKYNYGLFGLSTNVVPTRKVVVLVMVTTPTETKFYLDGELWSETATRYDTGDGLPHRRQGYPSGYDNSMRPFAAYMTAGWYDALTEAEVQSFSDNPWQIFRDQPTVSYSLPLTPAAPTGLSINTITPISATAAWTDASNNETGFKVQVSASPYSSWTAVTTTAADATSQAISNLTDGTTYKARVASTNASGDSAWVESSPFDTIRLGRLRPVTVSSAGPWTASSGTAVTAVDELTADDADYITADSAGTIAYKIESSTNPSSNNYHAVNFRARATGGRTVTVKWWQGNPSAGGTEIASTAVTPGSSFSTYRLELTSGQAAGITDRTNVYVTITRD